MKLAASTAGETGAPRPFPMTFSTLILKLKPSLEAFPLLRLISRNLTTQCLAVSGGWRAMTVRAQCNYSCVTRCRCHYNALNRNTFCCRYFYRHVSQDLSIDLRPCGCMLKLCHGDPLSDAE